MIRHWDPGRLAELATILTGPELRVLLAAAGSVGDGRDREVMATERRLAKDAGYTSVKELRPVVASLLAPAEGRGAVLVRAGDRLRLALPDGLFIDHLPYVPGTRAPAGDPRATRLPPVHELAQVRARAASAVEAQAGPRIAEIVEAWIARLAELEPDRCLPLAVQVIQYETALDLHARFGAPVTLDAFMAALAGRSERSASPERYVRAIAEQNARPGGPVARPSAPLDRQPQPTTMPRPRTLNPDIAEDDII